MKILSQNVQGLNSLPKQHQVLNFCKAYDISLLQETKLTPNNLLFLKAKWGSDLVYLASPGTARRGVITLIHPRCSPIILFEIADPKGQYHIAVIRIKDTNYVVGNIYGNPDTDIDAYTTLADVTNKLERIKAQFNIDHYVIGGDFNLCLERRDSTSSSRKPRAESQLITIINTFNLFDAAAILHQSPKHTYYRARRENTSARYDRFYVDPNLIQGMEFKTLQRISDHCPIQISFMQQQGRKNWKFTDTLLTSQNFLQGLHNCLRDTLNEYTNTQNQPLNTMQNDIDFNTHSSTTIFSKIVENTRKYCMEETKKLRDKKKKEENQVIQELIRTRKTMNETTPPNDEAVNDYEKALEKLLLQQTKRQQSASDTNFTNFATLGERTTRYHFARSNRGKATREIPRLVIETDQGQQTLEGTDLRQHMFQKYKILSQPDNNAGTLSIQQFLGHDLMQSLRKCPPEHHSYLTSPILPIEIKNIVKELKHNSAPGPLGITNALVKELVPFMTSIMVDFGNKLFFEDDPTFLPWFFHRFVIFILKPGKPTTCEDSYRGLSLLEVYFKIFSKIIATRMKRPMRHIQNPQQFGFTEGKGIQEATRTVLDVAQYAKRNNLPLILLSTDFYKAFDSISIDHTERCLELYEFPNSFKKAYMRLARNGTVQFEVNSELSEDIPLLKGTSQGNPKSSFGFNISSAPLNHYLAESPVVPRFQYGNEQISPVFFADDAMLALRGDQIQRILETLNKIEEYYRVSGLKLNLKKCEILTINCNNDDIATLLQRTGMKQVNTLKHLGVYIDNQGILPHDKNIQPLSEIMNKIADSFNSTMSTPLGRSIYAKYLLGTKYLHRIQNFPFTEDQLAELRKSIIRLTWTRARPGMDANARRVHIAHNRVAQPLYYGGLSVPDPIIQSQSLSFSWARKFCKPNQTLSWTKMLEKTLELNHRPSIQDHTMMGPHEWKKTSNALTEISKFWAITFKNIGNLIQMSHDHDKNWAIIPLIGYENSPIDDISSLSHNNPVARAIFNRGLINFGQLFNTDDRGQVLLNSKKTYQSLENEFQIQIPIHMRNRISAVIRSIKQKYRTNMATTSQTFEAITTLQSLVRSRRTGCNPASRLILKDQRKTWDWGEIPRSFATYLAEGLVNINSQQFSKSLHRTRSNYLPPGTQWTNITIFLRTVWTNLKEANTRRNLLQANPVSPNCTNCGTQPERTTHLFFECPMAMYLWTTIISDFNEQLLQDNPTSQTIIVNRNLIMFNYIQDWPDDDTYRDIIDIVMTIKHRIYRYKFRDNIQRFPTNREALLFSALDIEKIILIRQHSGLDYTFIEKVNNKIKARVGM